MQIEVTAGPSKGKEVAWDLAVPCFIGRDKACDVVLNDREVSRQHARVYSEGGQVMVEDLGSRNGTLINGESMSCAALFGGDELRIGQSLLRMTGIAPVGPVASTMVAKHGDLRVLATLDHADADLLRRAGDHKPEGDLIRENRILRHVGELSNMIAAARRGDDVMTRVLDRAQDLLGTDTACVLLCDDDGAWTVTACAGQPDTPHDLRLSRTIISQAVGRGNAVLTDDPMTDERFAASDSIVQQKISSAVCAPMKIENAYRGVLYLSRTSRQEALSAMDLRFAATVANLLGVYLEKERLRDEFIRSERLAAVGEMIAGLAHYAKNIITGLQLSVSTLERMLARDQLENIGTCVAAISGEERRLSDLILDMLTYAKERKPLRLETDLAEVVQGVLQPYREKLEAQGIALETELDPDACTLWAEKNSLHRVFLNLIGNALDAMKEVNGNGILHVAVTCGEVPDMIEIRVRDSGCGIPADQLQKIFNVMYSTKGSRGTGLGLAVSRKIVEEHGGTIAVSSEEGRGTEFRITLPRGEAQIIDE